MHRHRTLVAAVAVIAALGVSACSDEEQDDLADTADSVADDVADAAESAATAVGEAVDETGDDAAELAARNIATQQGEEQFSAAGHELDDSGLSCEATVEDGVDGVAIDCTGTTADGGAAALTGSTTEIPGASVTSLEGNFSGTVDGTEVFTTQTLGG